MQTCELGYKPSYNITIPCIYGVEEVQRLFVYQWHVVPQPLGEEAPLLSSHSAPKAGS